MVEASTLGWQSLDRADLPAAWQHYEQAKNAARESGPVALLAHALAEQTVVLLALDLPERTVEQAAHARALAEGQTPALLRAWLAAAHGEALAVAGDRDGALRAFDAADALMPRDPRDPALPFVFLGAVHLARWRGHAVARLGDPDAIAALSGALHALPPSWVRSRTRMLVDLATAHAAAGDRDGALTNAREARRRARQIHSDQQLRHLSGLVLPNGVSIASA